MPDTDARARPEQVRLPDISLGDAGVLIAPGADAVALATLPGDPDGGPLLGPGSEQVLAALGVDGLDVLDLHRASGKAGEVISVPVATTPDGADPDGVGVTWLHLVGVGQGRPADLRRAGAALARAGRGRTRVASAVSAVADPDGLEAFVVGVALGAYRFDLRSEEPLAAERPVQAVVLVGHGDQDSLAARIDLGVAKARAAWRARQLASVPSNIKTPAWLAEQARELAAGAGLDVGVWDVAALTRDGFGGILGVGQASAAEPRLIRLDYTPRRARRRTPHLVLVGKGITFDTGGLSIKPGEAMVNMKRDMTGGAVVIATLAALAEIDCPIRVTGLVAAAENAVSGSALRPGDVITHYGGRTSEVTNTDAEGRLVLADALAYAVAELAPDAVVDIATLTGAMKVALGQRTGGYFSNNEDLAAVVEQAAASSGEPVWRMPLAAEYEDKLRSEVADADNAPGGPGAIIAALFLQHFVGEVPWVHLDVASVGDSPSDSFEWSVGPTGFGARLLLDWLGREQPLPG